MVETEPGRIGGFICWATARHVAIEPGAFVISVPQYIERGDFPDDFPVSLPDDEAFGRGGAAIIEPRAGRRGPSLR